MSVSRWRPTKLMMAEILAVVLGVAVFYAMHLNPSRMASGGDFANLFWPMKELRLRALQDAGVFLLWNPYIFMGSPASATMQHAIFYPVDYLFFWRSPTIPALNLYVLFHDVLCGVGAWFWMRIAWRSHPAGAILAGIVFPCTAWFWGAQEHINQVGTVAWMPWMLGVALLFARERICPRIFVTAYALLGALQFLAGHPQAAFYTHVTASLIVIAMALFRWKKRGWREPIRAGAFFLLAGMLMGSLIAVQLLPAMELSAQSYRQFQGIDPAYSMTFSMPPDVLVTAIKPNAFGDYIHGFTDIRAYNEYGVYAGWGTLLLAILGIATLSVERRKRRMALFLAAIVWTVLMALGGNASVGKTLSGEFSEFPTPVNDRTSLMQDVRDESGMTTETDWLDLSLHEILTAVVPPLAGFRVPARILIVTMLLVVTLAGFGLDALLEWLRRILDKQHLPRTGTWVTALATVAISLCWWTLYVPSANHKFRFPKDTAPLLLEWEADRELREGESIDQRLFRLTSNDLNLILAERERDAEIAAIQPWKHHGVWLRWMRWQENNNAVVALPSIEGYEEGLAPTVRTKDFLFAYNRHLRQYEPDAQFLALLGIGRVFADLPINPELFPPVPGESRGPRWIFSVPSHRGAAFWAGQAEGIDFARLEGPYWQGGNPYGRRQGAMRDYGKAPNWSGDYPRIRTSVTNPNRVVLECAGTVPGDAVLSIGYAPGWRIGNEEAEWLGAVHVRVPREAFANGQAVLRYEPASYRMGLFLTVFGAGVWVFLLAAGLRQNETPCEATA